MSHWKRLLLKCQQAFFKDEKLPYLNKITKRNFLVGNKNMELCLYKLIRTQNIKQVKKFVAFNYILRPSFVDYIEKSL